MGCIFKSAFSRQLAAGGWQLLGSRQWAAGSSGKSAAGSRQWAALGGRQWQLAVRLRERGGWAAMDRSQSAQAWAVRRRTAADGQRIEFAISVASASSLPTADCPLPTAIGFLPAARCQPPASLEFPSERAVLEGGEQGVKTGTRMLMNRLQISQRPKPIRKLTLKGQRRYRNPNALELSRVDVCHSYYAFAHPLEDPLRIATIKEPHT